MRTQPGEPGPRNRATTCDAAAGVNPVAEGLGNKLTGVRFNRGGAYLNAPIPVGKGGAWVELVRKGIRKNQQRRSIVNRGYMADDPEFNKFWDYYPKKKSKGDAYKAWQQEKKNRPPLADVLKAIVVLKNSDDWQRDDGKWIPYPATWIRSWGWADVPEVDKRDVRGNEMWCKTTSGIEAKAKELGMEWDALNGETFQQFAERVRGRARDMKIVPLAGAA